MASKTSSNKDDEKKREFLEMAENVKSTKMTITVKTGEETISFQTDSGLHISEFRDLMMRLAAAIGYDQSNIEEYFLQDEEKSECCGAKYDKPNEETISNFQKPNVEMGVEQFDGSL